MSVSLYLSLPEGAVASRPAVSPAEGPTATGSSPGELLGAAVGRAYSDLTRPVSDLLTAVRRGEVSAAARHGWSMAEPVLSVLAGAAGGPEGVALLLGLRTVRALLHPTTPTLTSSAA